MVRFLSTLFIIAAFALMVVSCAPHIGDDVARSGMRVCGFVLLACGYMAWEIANILASRAGNHFLTGHRLEAKSHG